jgi:hypothetical protein
VHVASLLVVVLPDLGGSGGGRNGESVVVSHLLRCRVGGEGGGSGVVGGSGRRAGSQNVGVVGGESRDRGVVRSDIVKDLREEKATTKKEEQEKEEENEEGGKREKESGEGGGAEERRSENIKKRSGRKKELRRPGRGRQEGAEKPRRYRCGHRRSHALDVEEDAE